MRRAALLAIASLIAVGCGVRGQSSAQPIDAARLPAEPPVPTATGPAVGVVMHVYFTTPSDHLAAVDRTGPPGTAAALVRRLLAGPTDTEVAAGVRTAIPTGTRLEGLAVEGSSARLDLSANFASVSGEEQVLAVAQLVLTVTDLPYVDSVALAIGGKSVDVPRADGSLSSDPVVAADYASLNG